MILLKYVYNVEHTKYILEKTKTVRR